MISKKESAKQLSEKSLANVAEKLAIKARSSLSKYCSSECKAYCCRKGYLLLKPKELKVMNINRKDLFAEVEEGLLFNLESKCPNLNNSKCKIHKNPERPKACKEFPLFIWEDKTVMVSYKCPAAKENLLYPYLAKFKTMGYKITYTKEK